MPARTPPSARAARGARRRCPRRCSRVRLYAATPRRLRRLRGPLRELRAAPAARLPRSPGPRSASSRACSAAGTAPSPLQRAPRHRRARDGVPLARWRSPAAPAGATWRRSLVAALVAALAPEIAVGLFALTPDLLLAFAWTGALGLAAHRPALRAAGAGARRIGVRGGRAARGRRGGVQGHRGSRSSWPSSSPTHRVARARTRARSRPWAGLAAGALIVAPVVAFEARTGWPMLRHRLVDTQADAGLSLRNVGALARRAARLPVAARRRARRARGARGVARAAATPSAGCSSLRSSFRWPRSSRSACGAASPSRTGSRPPLLALVHGRGARAVRSLATARSSPSCGARGRDGRRRPRVGPRPGRGPPRAGVVRRAPRHQQRALRLARRDRRSPRGGARRHGPGRREPADVAVVGPHWVVCAQLEAACGARCRWAATRPSRTTSTPGCPRTRWRAADVVVWVDDGRFGPPPALPRTSPYRTRRITGRPRRPRRPRLHDHPAGAPRAGVTVTPRASPARPASRRSARSSSASGFGVVSSRSP